VLTSSLHQRKRSISGLVKAPQSLQAAGHGELLVARIRQRPGAG
jgi:hypothetical protein